LSCTSGVAQGHLTTGVCWGQCCLIYSVELFDLFCVFLFAEKKIHESVLLTLISVTLGSNCILPMQDVVNNICDDEDIKAVSFVGSNTVSESSILSVYLSVAQFFQYAVYPHNTYKWVLSATFFCSPIKVINLLILVQTNLG
jgi:hypothetical protein